MNTTGISDSTQFRTVNKEDTVALVHWAKGQLISKATLLCEWPIEFIGKCFVFYLYLHLNIRSNKSAYIAGICFRM